MTNEFLDAIADAIAARLAVKLAPNRRVASRLMPVKEAAEYLGLTEMALRHRKDLPTLRAGRRVFYDVRDLDRWIEENKV